MLGALGRLTAAFTAWLVGDVLRVRRAHVEHAMARADVATPLATARGMYRSLALGLLELVGMAVSRRSLDGLVQVPHAAIASVRAAGRGAVVATAHTGNWDLSACAVAAHAPLVVVTKRLRVRFLDRLWQGARRARGVRLVGAGEAATEVAGALARGELVAMLVDQAPERTRGAVRVPFLGAEAWVDLAPALCAARARVPVVVAFPRRLGDGTHTIDVPVVISPPAHPSRAWVETTMREVTAALETHVRRHPDQWLWMHRRWKAAPGALPGGRAFGGLASPSS